MLFIYVLSRVCLLLCFCWCLHVERGVNWGDSSNQDKSCIDPTHIWPIFCKERTNEPIHVETNHIYKRGARTNFPHIINHFHHCCFFPRCNRVTTYQHERPFSLSAHTHASILLQFFVISLDNFLCQ